MSEPISTKPYLIRALYEWCTDNGYTPYIAVKVYGQVHVPMEFVRDGDIVLNIAFAATSGLKMDNQAISFKARFGGVSRDIYVPIDAVAAIYASENNQGMAFAVVADAGADAVTKSVVETTAKKETGEVAVSEKPMMSLAVTNTEKSSSPDDKKSKGNRKKPSFTVIK